MSILEKPSMMMLNIILTASSTISIAVTIIHGNISLALFCKHRYKYVHPRNQMNNMLICKSTITMFITKEQSGNL